MGRKKSDNQETSKVARTGKISRKKVQNGVSGLYSSVFNCLPEAILILSYPDKTVTDLNDAFIKKSGYPRKEVAGKRWSDLNLIDGLEDSIFQGPDNFINVKNSQIKLKTSSGKLLTLLNEIEYFEVGGKQFFLLIFRDISDSVIKEPVRDVSVNIEGVTSSTIDVSAIRNAEEALRKSEERYRTLFDSMTEGFALHEIITDESGRVVDYRFLDVNPAFEALTGLKRSDLLGKRVREVIPGIEEFWIENYGKVALTGEPANFENYTSSLDRWYEVFVYRSAPGQFAVVFTDITSRKHSIEALQASEANYERAQAVGNIGSWRLDLRKNELVWSEQNYRIFGVAKDTPLTYENFLSFLHPDDREYVDRKWKESMEGKDYDIEHRVISSGVVKWVREKAFLEFDEKGELLAGFGITQDISDRKNAEEELAQSRLKLDLALENANVGLWEWNVKTNEMSWDARTEKMFGVVHGTFENSYSSFEKLIHEEDLDHVRKAIRNTLQNDLPFETVFRTRPDKGQIKYLSCKALGNRNSSGEILSLTGVIFDITDLQTGTERLISKLNEDLLRSNKELESFAYITSHDLQEPLRMVTSFTQLLAMQYSDKLDDTATEYIAYAVDGATRMYELINSLLAYSRISRKDITFREVDVNKIIESVKSNLILLIEERHCKITTENLPVIFADENMIIQLFQNLIINGIKFSKGAPIIHISSRLENNYHIFSVRDQGIGIEAQYFEKIFQIFKRLVPRDEYEGTGIGLAICKRIVENHGGSIWVESEPGKGSVFYFSVPNNR